MTFATQLLLGLSLAQLLLLAGLWRYCWSQQHQQAAALREMTLELAFIAGRIGLRRSDLRAAVEEAGVSAAPAGGQPEGKPEIIGDLDSWGEGDLEAAVRQYEEQASARSQD
jgi:hypothetical protein